MRRLELEMCLNAAPDMEQVEASFESALESELPAQLKVHYLGLHFALFFLVLTFAFFPFFPFTAHSMKDHQFKIVILRLGSVRERCVS